MIEQHNLVVYRGDTFAERLTFTDTDGVAVNITGWTIFFTLKTNKKDTDTLAIISKTITIIPNPELGIYDFVIPASELNTLLGMYYYDFQIKLADGKIYTFMSGSISFIEDISRRTT